MARTRHPRRRDGPSAVCLRGNRPLSAGMGVPVDLLRGGGPHHPVPHAKRPRPSPASHERWSDCGKSSQHRSSSCLVHHSASLPCSSCRRSTTALPGPRYRSTAFLSGTYSLRSAFSLSSSYTERTRSLRRRSNSLRTRRSFRPDRTRSCATRCMPAHRCTFWARRWRSARIVGSSRSRVCCHF